MDRRAEWNELIEKTRSFHGHMCPGLALGIRASEVALREIGAHAKDEEVVAVVETDMCGVDAIQFLTGCTFGKGNLIHRDYGKSGFSFFRRSDGKGIRVAALPSVLGSPDPERAALLEKMRAGAMTDEEQARFALLQAELSRKILDAPLDELFRVSASRDTMPARARIHPSSLCDACGEQVMETRVRRAGDKVYCIPCFEGLPDLT